MPTVSVNLDTTQYVQVNTGFNPMVLQCLRDSVRITLSEAKPAIGNSVFHSLSGKDAPLPFNSIDTNVWALAVTENSSLIVSETEPVPVALHDSDGNPINSLGGAIDVHDADVHRYIVNKHFHQHTATTTTLAVALTGDGTEYQITVDSATGFANNDFIHLNTTTPETTHPKIINITGNVFTLDRRIDSAHDIGDNVTKAIIDMALTGQVGTMASPQEYAVWPEGGQIWHLTRILFAMSHGVAGDLGKFGGITALTNGILIRAKINGVYGTLTNWKTNADMKMDMFDVEFDARSGGGGAYGTSGRGTFTETGAVVRLDAATNDRLEIYVQDDITLLDFFGMKAQGHLEG